MQDEETTNALKLQSYVIMKVTVKDCSGFWEEKLQVDTSY